MKIVNKADVSEIYIYEDIGAGWFGGVTAKDFAAALKSIKSKDVMVRLNSPGGDVFEAAAIYSLMVGSDKNITTQVDGLAASAASHVFMAGRTRSMAEGAFLMIHNAWSVVAGDASALRQRADALDAISDSLAKAYSDGTGASMEQVKAWMNAETWFTAAEAFEHGFSHETGENLKMAAKFDPERYGFRHVPVAALPQKSDVTSLRLAKMSKRTLALRSK